MVVTWTGPANSGGHRYSLVNRVAALSGEDLDVYACEETGQVCHMEGRGSGRLETFVDAWKLDLNIIGSPTLWSWTEAYRRSHNSSAQGWVWSHGEVQEWFPFARPQTEFTVHFDGESEVVTALVDWSKRDGNPLKRIKAEWVPLERASFESLSGTTVAKVDWRFIRVFDDADLAQDVLLRHDIRPLLHGG